MKNVLSRVFLIAVFAVGFSSLSPAQKSDPSDFRESISPQELKEDLTVFAHDWLQGRDTGSEGLKKAADFLASEYETAGLIPIGDDSSYFQHFELNQNIVDGYSYTITGGEGDVVEKSVYNKDQYGRVITVFGGNSPLEGPVVYVGAGAFSPEEGINHYKGDFEGKWLMLFYDEEITNTQKLQQVIAETGSNGALFITSPQNPDDFIMDAESGKSRFGNPRGLELVYLQKKAGTKSPAYNRIHPELAATLLDKEDPESLVEMKNKLKVNLSSFTPRGISYRLSHSPDTGKSILETKNVLAYLEGSDPDLKDEVVVLSSHYDHVGVGRPDSTGDTIYNGADDDGSGTIAILHVAKALARAKKAGVGPKRSVLFLHVSAEEKGLLGSRYYSDHPVLPIEKTIANLNVDMIGRIDPEHAGNPNYVYVIGGHIISSGLDSLINVANRQSVNLDLSQRYNDLNDPNQFYRRSDHWNFGRLGVPFVFFFNGVHADYHRPSDEIDKINFEALTKRSKLLFQSSLIIANAGERPVVDNQVFIERTQLQPR